MLCHPEPGSAVSYALQNAKHLFSSDNMRARSRNYHSALMQGETILQCDGIADRPE